MNIILKIILSTSLFMTLVTATALADDFDLSYYPKDKKECSEIMQKMLKEGEEISYRKAHASQKLWLFRPEDIKDGELRPCVFFIHGGSWGGTASAFAPQCIYLKRRGIVAVSIHFRKPDRSPKDCLADVLSAFRWVKKYGKKYNIDHDRIVISGGSAGGHLALAMVTIPGCDHADDDLSINIDPKGLILFNPVIDLVEGWPNGQKICEKAGFDPATFSPAHHVKPGLPETLILSGENDEIITPKMIKKFSKRMAKHDNKSNVIIYPDVNHAFFNYGRLNNIYFNKTMNEVDKFLAKLGYIKNNNDNKP